MTTEHQENKQVFTTNSPAETTAFANRMAGFLESGMTVALYGELGTGKTQFARGVAEGLGITEPITSPTFNIVQEYQRPDGDWLYHLDMYRIPDVDDALNFDVDEYIFNQHAVTLIEWPEHIETLLKPAAAGSTESHQLIVVYLAHTSEEQRTITVERPQ